MKIRATIVMLLSVFAVDAAYAQAKKRPAPISAAQMREQGNPGPEHAELAKYAGGWTVEIKLGRGRRPAIYQGLSKHRMVAGDRFLQCEFEAQFEDKEATGILTLGFDRRHGEFTIQSIDSWGTYFVTARGKRAAGAKTVKLYGKDDDPYLKALLGDKEFAYEVDLSRADALTIKVFMIDPRTTDRAETQTMVYRFTRAQFSPSD